MGLIAASVTAISIVLDQETATSNHTAEAHSSPDASAPLDAGSNEFTIRLSDDSSSETRHSELFDGNAILARIQLQQDSFKKVFVFPDDQAVEVRFDAGKARRGERLDIDVTKESGPYEPLLRAAEAGSGRAASKLQEFIEFCSKQPRSREELERRLHAVTEGVVPPPVPAPVEETTRWLTQNYQRCKGMGEEEAAHAARVLRSTADAGDPFSAWHFAATVKDTEPAEALVYYRKAWEAGIAGGGIGVANLLLAKESVTYEDAVRAYGYRYAAHAVQLALYDGLPGDMHRDLRQQVVQEMEAFTANAPASAIQDGIRLAKQLLDARSQAFLPM